MGNGRRDDMASFSSDGVRIAYIDTGGGTGGTASDTGGIATGTGGMATGTGGATGTGSGTEPVLLLHGFASSVRDNWVDPGWVDVLVQAGFRVIAMDNRGHGESEKLYDQAAYAAPIMAEDARRLLDHLGLPRADVMGYSMGARITAFLALAHPGRVRSAIFAGLGGNMVRPMAGTGPIAAALEARSIDEVQNPTARTFRAFAERTGSDLKALAACIRGGRDPISREAIALLRCPVLVVAGSEDVIAGRPEDLAALIPGAEALTVPRRDHMRTVGDRVYKDGVLAFLRRQ
jgi:pimeloyl-ACP methyl ester carboxylesterase